MRTAEVPETLPEPVAEPAEHLRSDLQQAVAALQEAVGPDLDRGLEGDPEGAASLGLSCPAWLN